MSEQESDAVIGRLFREWKQATDERLRCAELVKQIADALKRLAMSLDRMPDFEAVSKDSILHDYLDLSKIGAVVVEESEWSKKQENYETRLRALGFVV